MSRGCRNRIGVCRRREGIRPAPTSPHPGLIPPPSSRFETPSPAPLRRELPRSREGCPARPLSVPTCRPSSRGCPGVTSWRAGGVGRGEATGVRERVACCPVPAPVALSPAPPLSRAHGRGRRVREASRGQDARELAGWVAGGLGRVRVGVRRGRARSLRWWRAGRVGFLEGST